MHTTKRVPIGKNVSNCRFYRRGHLIPEIEELHLWCTRIKYLQILSLKMLELRLKGHSAFQKNSFFSLFMK